MLIIKVGYTGVYNVLDYSAISFATGFSVDKNIDKIDPGYESLGPICKEINEECESDCVPLIIPVIICV